MQKLKSFIVIMLLCCVHPLSAQQVCSGAGSSDVLPTKCFEIESILVNACSNNEGYDEMVRLRVGPNPLTLNSINTVVWPTVNTWLGWATYNGTTLAKLTTINNTITAAGNCGRLIKLNPTDVAPAYARILVITSTVFSTTSHDFSGLKDTLYVAMQNNNSVVGGHFANTTTNTARTLIMRTSTCGDTVTHYGNLMIKLDGTPGSDDGSGVSFNYAGQATYYNYGCALPSNPFTVDAGTTAANYCSGNSVPLNGTISGSACFYWYPQNRAAGAFSDSTLLTTQFNIAPGFTGTVKLYLLANANCSSKLDSVSFNVNPPSGSISITAITDTVRCNKNALALAATSSSVNPITWSTTGKGSYSSTSSLNTNYTPSVNDTVAVWFSVTQNQSCGVAKDSIRVRFTASPKPVFTPTDTVFCTLQAGAVVPLNPLVTGGVFSGTGVSGTNFVVPATAGNYPVKYVVSLNGCTDSLTRLMVVNNVLSASFTVSDTFVCLGTKSITVNPTNPGGTFSGITLVGNVFTPTVPGVFVISYKIGNGTCIDSVGKRIYVSPQPNASFTATDSVFCLAKGSAMFTPATPGGIFSGTHVTGAVFTPLSVGTHTVKYIVTNLGCTDSTTKNMVVDAMPNAAFNATDTVVCEGSSPITLTPTTSGGVFSGVGVVGNVFTPTNAGSFTISYVLNNGTCKDSVVHTILVSAKPDADFTLSDTVLCEGDLPVTINTNTAGGVFSGATLTANQFIPTTAGVYNLTYLINNNGCKDSVTHTIVVNAKPLAAFTTSPAVVMVNDTVQFTYTGGSVVNQYLWRFGDGNTSTQATPTNSYSLDKSYSVWLTVTNSEGCVDSVMKTIKVDGAENIFVPNVFTPNQDTYNDLFEITHMGIHNYHIYIYNRWGGLVYESNNPDGGWDGKSNGSICPESVYVFLITYQNSKQITKTMHGTITLIR